MNDPRAAVGAEQGLRWSMEDAHVLDLDFFREPYIMAGGSGLMPTRSLGDPDFALAGVIPTPSTRRKVLNQDDLLLILACDGLFDVMANQEVAELARSARDPERVVQDLKHEAMDVRMTSDNLTVICLDLPSCLDRSR